MWGKNEPNWLEGSWNPQPHLHLSGPLGLHGRAVNLVFSTLTHTSTFLMINHVCHAEEARVQMLSQGTIQPSGLWHYPALPRFCKLSAGPRVSPDAEYSIKNFLVFTHKTRANWMLCSSLCRLLCIPYYIFHYMSFGQFRKYHPKTMWTDLAFTVLLYTQLFDAYHKHKLLCWSCATGSLKYSTGFVYICKKKQYETRTSHVIKAFYLLKHNKEKTLTVTTYSFF